MTDKKTLQTIILLSLVFIIKNNYEAVGVIMSNLNVDNSPKQLEINALKEQLSSLKNNLLVIKTAPADTGINYTAIAGLVIAVSVGLVCYYYFGVSVLDTNTAKDIAINQVTTLNTEIKLLEDTLTKVIKASNQSTTSHMTLIHKELSWLSHNQSNLDHNNVMKFTKMAEFINADVISKLNTLLSSAANNNDQPTNIIPNTKLFIRKN
jgi:hypothetical protein